MTIENILILDTETTGLEPTKGAKVIEIGAILYNLRFKTILQNFSTLLPCDANEAYEINLIKPAATQQKMPLALTHHILISMLENAQAVVAHNAQFDKKFINSIEQLRPHFGSGSTKWICTKADFKWPVQLYRNRLQDICTAMGVAYIDAHRALNDCNLLAQCFSKVENLEGRFNQGSKNTFTNGGVFL